MFPAHQAVYGMKQFFTRIPFYFILSFLFLPGILQAQEVEVTLKVINQKKDPIRFATVSVINGLDTTLSNTQSSDSNGITVFKLLKSNPYTVRITSVNYQPIEKGILVTGNSTHFSFTADPLPKTLGGVTVTSRKPLMRQEDDKTIVDPENLASTSTSGYEVIEKTPGLFVDQDGNIYIASLSPAAIHINGREMKMSASDIATMLKSLPPTSIARIEIIKSPSAKYDASGGGGIVNVVLKKGVRLGMTGSLHTGMQQGKYGNQFLGFTLNNNDGKKSSYINLNYTRRNSYERIRTDRIFSPDSMLAQDAYTKYPSDIYFAGLGINYAINKKWETGYDARFSLNDFANSTNNATRINKISTGDTVSDFLNLIDNKGHSMMVNQGINLKYKIDSSGSEWTNDASFTYAQNKSNQVFDMFSSTGSQPLSGGDGKSDNRRNFFTAQSDLKWKFPKKYTLETGLKTSILRFKSVTNYFTETSGNREKDFSRTNTFNYNENINAAYLQASKTITDIVFKAGARLENTNMKGRQVIPSDTSFTIHRTDLFPYVYLSKKVMQIAGYDLRAYLVYRRTINRPVYEQLNPFPRYVDQFLSEVGNPGLRPQFTTNYEANISVDERPIIAVGINRTKDIFTNVIYQSDSSQSQAYRTYDNLGRNKEWYFRAMGAIPPGGTYFFVIIAQYNHNFYQGLYENKPLSFKKGTWTFYTYHNLKLDKRSQLTVNGFMRLRGQQQFYELSSFGALNASINRQFIQQKLTVTFSVNDIFYSNKNDFTISQGSVSASGTRMADTRRWGINLRYNFGIRKKEDTNMFNVETNGT